MRETTHLTIDTSFRFPLPKLAILSLPTISSGSKWTYWGFCT